MTERDELARLLMSDAIMDIPDIGGFDYALHEAGVILAAGYRKPRTINTAEERESLPFTAVVRSDAGTIAARVDSSRGALFGLVTLFPWADLRLPITVLWEPNHD